MNKVKSGIIIIVVGLLFVGAGIFIKVRTDNKLKELDGVTKATEIDENCSEEVDSEGNKTVCHPIYTFEVDGTTYQCKSESTGGTIVNKNKNKVFYDTKDPENCMTEFEKSSSWFVYLIIAVGVLVVGLGIYNFFKKGE